MSQYIIKMGTLLAEVIERTASVQPAQFCGYWANADFWMAELKHFVALSNNYEERCQRMREAYDHYIELHGGPRNLDEARSPYQGVWLTTTVAERKDVLARLRTAFTAMAQRALKLELIELEEFDEFTDCLQSQKFL